MRIGIDARFLTHPQPGGFKTYTEQLIWALLEVDPENEYVLYVDRPSDSPAIAPLAPNATVRVVPGTAPFIGMPWREQIGLTMQAKRDQIDVLHALCLTAPVNAPCPLVVTIHDTIWMSPRRFSQQQKRGKCSLMDVYYRYVPQIVARRASAVITVSHDARAAIVQHLGIPAHRVFVTYEAAAPIYRTLDRSRAIDAVQQRFGLDADFILALGSADPRKNISTLLRAYALLPERLRVNHNLAIVWTHPLLADSILAEARANGIEGQLRFLQRVSNDDLVNLYNAAGLFVFPSRYEGFGLPILEAMACGAPVVASNNSSIPEVAGNAALLVDAESPSSIAHAMERVFSDESLRDELIARGVQRGASFSWQRCARETVAVYQKCYSGREGARAMRVA
jgi:glycosyltransferase involved in cell wall biosynthesis